MRARRRPALAKVLPTDSAWEAAKSARRNLDHNDAVQESAFLQTQYRTQWSRKVAVSPVDLNQILWALTRKKVPFVLTGAHAIGGWTGRPRATHDVDILVKGGRNHVRAVKVMKELYPHLETREFHGVTAFFVPGEKESVIDVTYPHRADIAETLANPVWTADAKTGLRYRVPSLEAALANKYGAMLTPTRDLRKRGQDALDFAWMVTHSMEEGRDHIDLQKLEVLGEKVWPGGGGEEILRLVEHVKAGNLIHLDSRGRFAN
jgi:hypothetical protein